MSRTLLVILTMLLALSAAARPDEYDIRRAESYTREAEYYQRKADGYRREAAYYLRQAENYSREAAYYTRNNKPDRAASYTSRYNSAMDRYKTQLRYAADADDKAAYYLRRAAALLNR